MHPRTLSLVPPAMSGSAAAERLPRTASEISSLLHIYKSGKWGVSLQEPLPFCPETWTFQR